MPIRILPANKKQHPLDEEQRKLASKRIKKGKEIKVSNTQKDLEKPKTPKGWNKPARRSITGDELREFKRSTNKLGDPHQKSAGQDQEPRRKRLQREHQLRTTKATGGRIGLKEGGGGTYGGWPKGGPSKPPKIPQDIRDKLKDLGRRKFGKPKWGPDGPSGGDKVSPGRPGGKGKKSPDKRWNKGDKFMTPLRAKKGVGGIAKIIGRKAVDWIKKNKKTIKKEIYSPEGKKKTQDLTKKLQEGLKKPGHAKGGRIGLQHGNRPRPQGPHTWVRKKPKGVKIAIKGW